MCVGFEQNDDTTNGRVLRSLAWPLGASIGPNIDYEQNGDTSKHCVSTEPTAYLYEEEIVQLY